MHRTPHGRKPRPLHLLLLLAFLFSGPGVAHASLSHDPFKLHLRSESKPAAAGQRYEGHVELEFAASFEVSDFELDGEGWTVHEVQLPAAGITDAGDRREIRFTATPQDPAQPLWVYFTADGKRARERLDLSPQRYAANKTKQPLIAFDGTLPEHDDESMRVPEPARDPADVLVAAQGEGLARARSITVSGRFAYTRSDGVTIGGYGLTAKVYDANGVFPAGFLGSDVTNSSGNFSVTFSWENFLDPDPDLYVEFSTESGRVLVKPEGVFSGPYLWTTSITNNYTGTNLDVGTILPSSESQMPRVHILTNATRVWAYVDTYAGFDTPKITYRYPSDNWPAYSQFFQEIYIPNDFGDDEIPFQWRESTHIHEWGHHFIKSFGLPTLPDYCNGLCDTQAEGWLWELDCGHCAWCQETATDAFAEGWPNWLADVVTRRYATSWGSIPALFPRPQEDVSSACIDSDGNACPCDPLRTEGHLGALLRDIEDSGQDDHDGDGLTDRLALGIDEIFFITTAYDVTTPAGFLNNFSSVYPQHRENLWETAFNVGYDIDDDPPGLVGSFTSPSHATTGDSPDRTVDLTWTHATDDVSGIAGYNLAWGSFPIIPATTPDVGKVTSFTTPTLAPGSWYFTIRSIDRSGKASASYRTYGPVTIRPADPANLAFYPRAGWAEVVVPRATNDATTSSVVAPIYLNTDTTYLNLSAQNNGESSISGQTTRIYVDDVYRYWLSWGTIGAGAPFAAVNHGPLPIRGGRHTFEARLDALGQVSETNEEDNDWAKQWIWGPLQLQPTGPTTYTKPPLATGGWPAIPAGTTTWFNADGYRMTSQNGFHATVVRATNLADDYDLRLHPMSTGASNGFTNNVGYSTRPAGCLDAVLTNAWSTGLAGFDVGVLNRYEGTSSYVIETYTAPTVAFGDSSTVAVPTNQHFVMRQFAIASGETGPVSITLECDPAGGPWHLMWFSNAFGTGDLLDYDAYAITDEDGRARLDLTIATASTPSVHGVVMFRDPKDGSAATSITYEISRTPPDFLAYEAPGWHSPLVPRPAPDGTTGSVPVPATLPGNVASTYFNVAVLNDSPTGVPGVTAHIFRDGVYNWYMAWGNFPGNANSRFNWSAPWTMAGGRHTLSVRHDVANEHEEISEANNIYGEQYVWSPLQLASGVPVSRSTPPDRTGGWDDIRSGEASWFNCDGLRTPVFAPAGRNGYWGFVALVPAGSSNVDLRLHEVSTGAKNGFAANLGYSGWGDGESDFLVMDFRTTAFRAFDVGALHIAGTGGYTAETGNSTWLPTSSAPQGPFTLGRNEIMNLYEMTLDVGLHILHVDNLGANLDLGVSVYGPGVAVRGKSSTLPDGAAWSNAAGEDEWITFEVTEAGPHAIAVWKTDSSTLGAGGDYRLRLDSGVTSVDPEVPTVQRTALASVTPNPFNPQTTIRFDVARAGVAELIVYNLRGELVRTLLREERAVGRHDVTWNGRDDRGNTVGSGVYTVLLRAGGVEDRVKVTLVK